MIPPLDFFDPLAFAFVWIGSLIIVGLQEGNAGLLRSCRAWHVLFRSDPVHDAQLARQALHRVENIVDLKGTQCIDRVSSESSFISRAITHLAQNDDLRHFSQWAGSDLDDREARHNSVIRFWLALADTAPSIGMIGTIFGLVRMFASLENSGQVGSAMSLALLTTLYGLILSNLVAAPISQRLLRLSAEELKWQRILTDKLIELVSTTKIARDCRGISARRAA